MNRGIFNNPVAIDRSLEEGTVLQVDTLRMLCKIRTARGEVHHGVQWLLPYGGSTRAGDRFTPSMGDRVFMTYGLGFPLIIGFLPKNQRPQGSSPLNLDTGEDAVDTGNYSPAETAFVGDMNKAPDLLMGDRVMTSVGGATVGLLRGGTLVLRASRAAEVLMSKFFHLVRVFSPNWEHFTDAFTDVAKSIKGRAYRFVGYSPTQRDGQAEKFIYRQFTGDVGAAEQVQANYNSIELTAPSGPSVSKEQVVDFPSGAPRELMRRTISLTGEKEVWIFNGTHFTRVNSTAEALTFSWNDQNTVTITEASIHAVHKDGADVIMDSNGIRATFSNGEIDMSGSAITVTKGASTGTFTNSDITLASTTGQAYVSGSVTNISNSGHMVAVTAGGVAIT